MKKMILLSGTEERRLVLKAIRENMPCQAIHICDEQPDNVKIWLNEIESHEGPDSEFWVMNRDGEAGGEQIDRCPYCGADLKQGAGDVAIVNDSPEFGDDEPDSADEANETPDSEDGAGGSADDEEKPDEADEKSAALPDGPDLSLRLPAFNSLFNTADDSLRNLARAMKTKLIESGELAVKIVLNNYGGTLKLDPKKCKVDCTPKPAKVSTALHFPDDLEIAVANDGRVIIPEDREHQMSFDEAPGGTVTVDGKTGIVEDYQPDDEKDEVQDEESNPAEEPYPCKNAPCPFYAFMNDAGQSGCGFDPKKTLDPFDVDEAIGQCGCTRPEVLQAYADAHPSDGKEPENESEDKES